MSKPVPEIAGVAMEVNHQRADPTRTIAVILPKQPNLKPLLVTG
jgi:hypothetical protein